MAGQQCTGQRMSVKDELHELVEQLDIDRALTAADYLRKLLLEPARGAALSRVSLSARMQPLAARGSDFFTEEPITLSDLARQQGVAPVSDPDELTGDFWPDDESVDDFIAAVHEWRRSVDERHV
jgi:hypothetical protein